MINLTEKEVLTLMLNAVKWKEFATEEEFSECADWYLMKIVHARLLEKAVKAKPVGNQVIGVDQSVLDQLGISENMDALEVLFVLNTANIAFEEIRTIDGNGIIIETCKPSTL